MLPPSQKKKTSNKPMQRCTLMMSCNIGTDVRVKMQLNGFDAMLSNDVQYLLPVSTQRLRLIVDGQPRDVVVHQGGCTENAWAVRFDTVRVVRGNDGERIARSLQDTKVHIYEVENNILHQMVLSKGQETLVLRDMLTGLQDRVHTMERDAERLKRRIERVLEKCLAHLNDEAHDSQALRGVVHNTHQKIINMLL